MTDVNRSLLMFTVKRVGIHGIEYRPGCVLRLREMDDVENDYPVYGQVDEIIVWEDEQFLILTELATLSFDHHHMAYEVERTDHKAVVCAMIYHGMEYCIFETAWPSGQCVGLAIRWSWVRVPLWRLAGSVLGRPELKSSATLVNSKLVASCQLGF